MRKLHDERGTLGDLFTLGIFINGATGDGIPHAGEFDDDSAAIIDEKSIKGEMWAIAKTRIVCFG